MQNLRKLVLEVAHVSKEGHIPSSLSVLDILFVAYTEFIELEDDKREHTKGNRFVLSKGHASLGLYVVMNHVGLISRDDLLSFAKFDSPLGGHPDRNKIPKIELSTGSLGHGFPQSVGMCKALKIKKKAGHLYVLIGDGECNEGSIWESALIASHLKLDNITLIIDNNLSSKRALDMGNLESKFTSFGWNVNEIDGHDHQEIKAALRKRMTGKPIVVLANTNKGFGVPTLESKPEWHHRSPNADELAFLLEETI